jgi:outer membrane protein
MLTHHIHLLVEPRYHNRFISNKTTQFTSAGASIGIDIYKGLQNQNTLRRAICLFAAKYQLLKMQEDIALNVANAFTSTFNKENLKVQTDQRSINQKSYFDLRN